MNDAPATSETPAYDVRGALAVQAAVARGWCQSPQRPDRALQIEILADGIVVAAGTAARLQLELVRPGVSNGYHGFALPLPELELDRVLLEAMESGTRQTFARRLPKQLADVAVWTKRATAMNQSLSAMHDALGRRSTPKDHLLSALAASGAFLAPSRNRQAAPPRLAIRILTNPDWSIILDLPHTMPRSASGGAAEAWALRAVASVAPLLGAARAELIAIDDGRAAAALTAVRGLTYCRTQATEAVSRLRQASALAAGARLAFIGDMRKTSLSECAALLAVTSARSIVIGNDTIASQILGLP